MGKTQAQRRQAAKQRKTKEEKCAESEEETAGGDHGDETVGVAQVAEDDAAFALSQNADPALAGRQVGSSNAAKDSGKGGYATGAGPPKAPQKSTADQKAAVKTDASEDAGATPEDDLDELVGFLEETPDEDERYLLLRRFFPSKVGGKPAWLIPDRLPAEKELRCDHCGLPLRFLMQIYASQGDYRPNCFHRTLHLFVCTGCQPSEVVVFRAQLPRKNKYYSSEAPDDEDDTVDDPELESALRANPLCTGAGRPSYYFDEHELTVSGTKAVEDSDDDDEEDDDEGIEAQLVKNALDAPEEKEEFDEYWKGHGQKDKIFKTFEGFAKRHPSHVVRYELGGKPLWYCTPGQYLDPAPQCENCGAPRKFEFQIQPQLISLLDSDRLDFGIVCIYSCSASCEPPKSGSAYLREWAYVQPEPPAWRKPFRGTVADLEGKPEDAFDVHKNMEPFQEESHTEVYEAGEEMDASDIGKCMQACQEKDFPGFVVKENMAYFIKKGKEDVEGKHLKKAKGVTTYIRD